jgi:(1->4)-alpha-D-glucan 1-alpha-D-glucosylmutase
VRVEEPDVFDATHRRILDAVRAGEIDGLRVDHPDGLADPAGYLEHLAAETGGIWTVAEKILEPGEDLPRNWACAGTTGYDAILTITHALLDPSGEQPLTEIYRELGGESASYEAVVEESKRYVVERVLVPEVDRLERELGDRAAIIERLVGTKVYRTYTGGPDNVRFEQTTGPVMAKGVEDTAFYRYFRLTALNEVGGDPGSFGISVEQWHRDCARRARDWPHAMTTLTTHDTKRTEDVRARLLVLAEMPTTWADAVRQWRAAARRHGEIDANTDYLFWQTLVGAWPLTVERMSSYLEKATREAKTHTSWIAPKPKYDAAVRHFTEALFGDDTLMRAVGDWCAEHIDAPGRSNALAQKLLQLSMPGVPDVYQGQEVTAPALVDPDNRRPVDYGHNRDEPKLLVTARTLRLRRERPAPFAGAYAPLEVAGTSADHAIAYLRGDDVAVAVTRLPVGLQRRGGFGDSTLTLPAGEWTDVFTGVRHEGTILLAETTATLPVALLRRETG